MNSILFNVLFKQDGDVYDINPTHCLKDFKRQMGSLKFEEDYDHNKLAYLLVNIDKVERLYREDARNAVPLVKYFEKDYDISDANIVAKSEPYKTKYYQSTGKLCGRLQAKNALSGQAMIREARNVIFNDNYVDIDISNAHPIFTEFICKNLSIPCEALSYYIDNRKETIYDIIDYIMKRVVDENKIEHYKNKYTYGFMKTYMLKIAYGCGDKAVDDIKEMYRHPFINKYVECMRSISTKVAEAFKPFHELNVKRRLANNKDYNLEGSTMSHLNQYVENQILMMMFKQIADEGDKINQSYLNKSILCFDGIMFHKHIFTKDFNVDSFIVKSERYLHGLGLDKFKLEVKPMELHDTIMNALAEDNAKYDKDVDYRPIFAKSKFKAMMKYYKELHELVKNMNFYSRPTEEQMIALIKAFELNTTVENYEHLKYSHFLDFIYNKQWGSLTEVCAFIKAVGHLFIVRLNSAKKQIIINKLSKYIQYEECEADCGIVFFNQFKEGPTDKRGVKQPDTIIGSKMHFNKLISDILINDIKRYDDIVFDPFDENSSKVKKHGRFGISNKSSFNIFAGFYAKLVSADDVEKNRDNLNIIYKHIYDVLAGKDEAAGKYILLWLHHIFTKPWEKTRKILTFISKEQQVGKGIFANGFLTKLIFGGYMAGMENGLDFASAAFNSQLKTRLLTIVEEVRPSVEARRGVFDALKTLCADDKILINEKYVKQRDFESFNNFILHSNHDDSLQIEDKDKRFVVFKCAEDHLSDKDYFKRLSNAMEADGIADAFFSDIYRMDFGDLTIKDSPETQQYVEMKEECASGPKRFYQDVVNSFSNIVSALEVDLDAGEDEDRYDIYAQQKWIQDLSGHIVQKALSNNAKDDKKWVILRTKLFSVYEQWSDDCGERFKSKFSKFKKELSDVKTHRFTMGDTYVLS